MRVENGRSLGDLCRTGAGARASEFVRERSQGSWRPPPRSSQFKYNRGDARETLPAGKMIHLRITNETVKQLEEIVRDLQTKFSDREVFIDGDEFAVCSTPKKETKRAPDP